jgi:hypothetical protein
MISGVIRSVIDESGRLPTVPRFCKADSIRSIGSKPALSIEYLDIIAAAADNGPRHFERTILSC